MKHLHDHPASHRHERRHPPHMHAAGPHEGPHRGPRHGPRYERGGRGGRRNFEAGGLRLVILMLLQEAPRHGYDAIREISARSGGAYTPSPGLVYPTLSALEDLGHIEQMTAEGSKRLFAITETGRAHLEENREEAEAAMARLETMNAEQSWTEAGPVQRALRNLEAVLRQGLSGKPEKAAQLAVADIIDDAARRIERL